MTILKFLLNLTESFRFAIDKFSIFNFLLTQTLNLNLWINLTNHIVASIIVLILPTNDTLSIVISSHYGSLKVFDLARVTNTFLFRISNPSSFLIPKWASQENTPNPAPFYSPLLFCYANPPPKADILIPTLDKVFLQSHTTSNFPGAVNCNDGRHFNLKQYKSLICIRMGAVVTNRRKHDCGRLVDVWNKRLV